ncbi:hypothetical protein D3C81_295640 [compost metagenome]
MPWYRTGTVAITAGQTTVTGTGTNFSANARVGDAFQGPDGRWYEVTNITSATVLTILPAYQGSAVAAGAYGLAPMQGYVKESADRLRQLVDQFGSVIAGLGAVSTENVVPVAKGGTGGTTQSAARSGIGALGAGDWGIGGAALAAPGAISALSATQFFSTSAAATDAPIGAGTSTGQGYGVRIQHANASFGFEDWTQLVTNRRFFRVKASGTYQPWVELYHTGNTTRGSGGALSAASPIVRIADVSLTERRDLQEQAFEPAGVWGVANDEARGVEVVRLDVGVYQVSGSLGLASEGWRTQDPCSPDGGRALGVTTSEQTEDGVVTIRLFKQRWTLSEDGEMVPGLGAPMDVPLNSWIDVRLDMPESEAPPELPPINE